MKLRDLHKFMLRFSDLFRDIEVHDKFLSQNKATNLGRCPYDYGDNYDKIIKDNGQLSYK